MRYGDDGAFRASAGGNAAVQAGKIGALGPRCGPSRLGQSAMEPSIPFTRLARLPFARAL